MWATPGNSYGTCAKETNDGGFIYTAFISSTFAVSWIRIIKTDSIGTSGCSDILVTVLDSAITPLATTLSLSNVSGFTSNTLAINTRWIGRTTTLCSISEIEDQNSKQISMYPNPTNGHFNFTGFEKGNKIKVFDITGRMIYQSIANTDFETINISKEAKGIYFYRVTNENKFVGSGRIALQ